MIFENRTGAAYYVKPTMCTEQNSQISCHYSFFKGWRAQHDTSVSKRIETEHLATCMNKSVSTIIFIKHDDTKTFRTLLYCNITTLLLALTELSAITQSFGQLQYYI